MDLCSVQIFYALRALYLRQLNHYLRAQKNLYLLHGVSDVLTKPCIHSRVPTLCKVIDDLLAVYTFKPSIPSVI